MRECQCPVGNPISLLTTRNSELGTVLPNAQCPIPNAQCPMPKSKTMLNTPPNSVLGGLFYPKGCMSQLLTVWTR
ncbi:MAG: hypothetical protein V7L20_32385 [Nostoc sp.]|uniref:hypothetical protein n=1 Tax=Nostoc sp. TaxID=1180 RepID=UPI002FF4A513